MTEDRKHYLENIDMEEAVVREEISTIKRHISVDKEIITQAKDNSAYPISASVAKQVMVEDKALLKVLKRRLPMRTVTQVSKKEGEPIYLWDECPCCGWIATTIDYLPYCSKCGQRLV